MGLTASPLSQPNSDKDKVFKEIQQLAVNLDSNYSFYEK